jgi:hypothetical protein
VTAKEAKSPAARGATRPIALVRHRLNALELAKALGDISEACRRRGICRSQFCKYNRRFQPTT